MSSLNSEPHLRPRLIVAAAATLAALSIGACGSGDSRPQSGVFTRIPAAVERDVHRTLHDLPRVCSRRRRDAPALDKITSTFVGRYRRYPADRYEMQIDDERGTMLSALLVLRYEFAQCSPGHAAKLDSVLPPDVRTALTPLPARDGGR